MSYIQIEIGGKLRGLKFNQLALEVVSTHSGETTTGFMYALIYGGLKGNSYVKREEPDYSFEDVCDWVDAMHRETKTKTIEEVTKVMTETQIYKDLIQTGEDIQETDKKKVLKKSALKT